ncbi:ABC transporter ATP-binding protein [Paenibacillus albus]|uniref:ATP-binding cassette domain-containing protein n=1 Tax=Paenibacillus albus TaxID=2495582 RepID=A0A3Q8X973_9BACL|nr:ABC transporter transmembrane domain-containing protein [Paenibacillus albus]AZN43285.1 ATP-binding cassette domain-containing protein [Paenibacillus albus]
MFDVLKKLSWFFKMHWKRYTLAIVLLTICGIFEVIPPRLIGFAIDSIGQGTMTRHKLTELLLLWAGLTVIVYLITYVWWSQLFGSSFMLERKLRSRLMRHLLKMTPTFYERNRTGDLMARATNDIGAVSNTAGFGILTLVDSTIWMATILVMMAGFISWKLTLAAMLPLPVLALVMQHFGKKIHERFTIQQDAFGKLNDQVLESVSGVRVIRAFVQEDEDRKRFSDMTDEVFRKNIEVTKIDALFEPSLKILVGISYLIGLCFGGWLVFRGEISLGDMVSFNMFLGMLIWPMFAIGELINIMQRGNASLDRINETLGVKPNVVDAESPVNVQVPESIETEGLTFRYPSSSIDNLVDINVKLQRGQTLGIVGRTGSGKTTLLRQLLREYPMGKGSLKASGVPITNIELDQIRSWVGYVPQQPILFSKTIRENIAYGVVGETMDDELLNKALELAAFRKDVTFLPDGLETLVGEKGVALSGGQKQRVSIARAVIANPEILMLDDALSAVDAKTETEILEGLRKERSGKTTLITTHRLSAVQHADWIIVLDEGRIAEEGTHEQLLLNNGWYKEQYDRQQLASVVEE